MGLPTEKRDVPKWYHLWRSRSTGCDVVTEICLRAGGPGLV